MAISISQLSDGGNGPPPSAPDVSNLDMGSQTTAPTPIIGTPSKSPWDNPNAALPGEALSRLGNAITTTGEQAGQTIDNIVVTQQDIKTSAGMAQARTEANNKIRDIQTQAAHDPDTWTADKISAASQQAWTDAYHKYMDPIGNLAGPVARHIAKQKEALDVAFGDATNNFIANQTSNIAQNSLIKQVQAASDTALAMSQDKSKGPDASAAAHEYLANEIARISSDAQFAVLPKDTIDNITKKLGAQGDFSIHQGTLSGITTNLTDNISTDPINNKTVTDAAVSQATAEINASNILTPEQKQTAVIESTQKIQEVAKQQFSAKLSDQRQQEEAANLRRETLVSQTELQLHDMLKNNAPASQILGTISQTRAALMKNPDFLNSPQGQIAFNKFGILQDEMAEAINRRDAEAQQKIFNHNMGMQAASPEELTKDYAQTYAKPLGGAPMYTASPDVQNSFFARYQLPANGLGKGLPKQPLEEAEAALTADPRVPGNAQKAAAASVFLNRVKTETPVAYGSVSDFSKEVVQRMADFHEDPATAAAEAREALSTPKADPVVVQQKFEQWQKDNKDNEISGLVNAASKAGIGQEPTSTLGISYNRSVLTKDNVSDQVIVALHQYMRDGMLQGQSADVAYQNAVSKLCKTMGYSRFSGDTSGKAILTLNAPEQLSMGNGGGTKSSGDAFQMIDADVKANFPFTDAKAATPTSPSTLPQGVPPDAQTILHATGRTQNSVKLDDNGHPIQIPEYTVGYVNKDGGTTQIPGKVYAYDPYKNEITDRNTANKAYTSQAHAYSQLAIADARAKGLVSDGGTKYGRYVQDFNPNGPGMHFEPEIETRLPSYDVRDTEKFPKGKSEFAANAQHTLGFRQDLWDQASRVHDIRTGAATIGSP